MAGSTVPEPESYEVPTDPTACSWLGRRYCLIAPGGQPEWISDLGGWVGRFYNDTAPTSAMAASIDASHHVNALYFQTSWDEYTAPFYEAPERRPRRHRPPAHHGMRTIPGQTCRRLNAKGIEWHEMLLLRVPCAGRSAARIWRNHRKDPFVIDGARSHIGSHTRGPDYDTLVCEAGIAWRRGFERVRHWAHRHPDPGGFRRGLVLRAQARSSPRRPYSARRAGALRQSARGSRLAMQIILSGPVFMAVRRTARVHPHDLPGAHARRSRASTSSPTRPLATALTNAALSGVEVEPFSEQLDQFRSGTQRSYYGPLLKAGVRIHLYRKPRMLHSKHMVVDGVCASSASSNMDVRSLRP